MQFPECENALRIKFDDCVKDPQCVKFWSWFITSPSLVDEKARTNLNYLLAIFFLGVCDLLFVCLPHFMSLSLSASLTLGHKKCWQRNAICPSGSCKWES